MIRSEKLFLLVDFRYVRLYPPKLNADIYCDCLTDLEKLSKKYRHRPDEFLFALTTALAHLIRQKDGFDSLISLETKEICSDVQRIG